MKKISILLLSAFIVTSSLAEEKSSANKENETKDQKFIFSNNVCLISKKEQDDANDYILSSKESQHVPLKLALTLIQLRVINGAKFSDIHCSLRYFIERYNDKYNRNWSDSDTVIAGIINEYITILEKLRTDPKTKADFEKNILNSTDMSYYYGVMDRNVKAFSTLDPSLARKIFSANLLNKKSDRINNEDWQILFNLYYSQNVAPPKEVSDFLKNQLLLRNGYQNIQMMTIYLASVNDLAYNDLFKNVFEMLPVGTTGSFFDSSLINIPQIKNIFASKYLPENLKCNYAKDILAKNAPKLSSNDISELKKINMSCVTDALADASKYVTPEDGCPQILFDKKDEHARLIGKMSSEFARNWTDCRRKCVQGDKCTPIQDSSGFYSFMNNKYEKDLNVYKEIAVKNPTVYGPSNQNMSLKYDYKPIGICNEKGFCGEKIGSCVDSDIIKKGNDELKAAKYQSCKVDTDCYIINVPAANCSEFAVNVNPTAQFGMPQGNKSRRIMFNGMSDFFSIRMQRLVADCGKPQGNQWACQQSMSTATTVPKCEKNLCVIAK